MRLGEWLQGPQAERAARVVTVLLVVWLAWQLARLTWLILPRPDIPPAAPAGDGARPAAGSVDGRQLAALESLHLFGQANRAETRPAAPVEAPDTRLNLVLHGVFASDAPGQARAIIAEPNGKEHSYGIGARLPGGAELAEVYPDRVILLRNGRHETLRLPQRTGASRQAPVSRARGRSPAARAAQDPSAVLAQYRDKINDNPGALLDLVRPEPVTEDGQFVGFRLSPGRQRRLFYQLGLRQGDVVTEVNGQPLDNAQRGIEVLQDLRGADALDVKVRRGGRQVTLNFALP